MTTVPYHRGPANHFSLSYVTPDADTFSNHIQTLGPPTRLLTAHYTHLPTPVYCAYTTTPFDSAPDVDAPDHPFVTALRRLFTGIVAEREAMGQPLAVNKSPDLAKIPSLLTDRVEWKQPVPTVGGQLLSNLILTHAFPNANHRTALGALCLYLDTVGAAVTVSDLEAADVDTYIKTSKRLLTVRRNTTKFRILADCGCTTVERKGGIQIPLAEYDLTVDHPYTAFAEAHERASIQFVEQLLADGWQTESDPGLDTFLARLDVGD